LDSPDNKDFNSMRKQSFGFTALQSIAANPKTGGANWYSVDRRGFIRVHYWYNMGYGRAWGRS
jgi:hypothetical protein